MSEWSKLERREELKGSVCTKLNLREEFNRVAPSDETKENGEVKGTEESQPSEGLKGMEASEGDGAILAG